jgi:hypothetical protein
MALLFIYPHPQNMDELRELHELFTYKCCIILYSNSRGFFKAHLNPPKLYLEFSSIVFIKDGVHIGS